MPSTKRKATDTGRDKKPSRAGTTIPSPNDSTDRRILDVKDLDLESPWKGTIETISEPERPKKYRPWPYEERMEPVYKAEDLPEDWHMNEDDLDPSDIDGQIERCKERIKENIRPYIFEHKLKAYEISKQHTNDELKSQPRARTIEVASRLNALGELKSNIERRIDSDTDKQLSNIKSLIHAYENHYLDWNPGLVTYWSKGQPLCAPRLFDWDEFEAINKANNGHESFWVEGLFGNVARFVGAEAITLGLLKGASNLANLTEVLITLRIPGYENWVTLSFCPDTGCDLMTLYEGDIRPLMGHEGPPEKPYIPVMGYGKSYGVAGTSRVQYFELEATILDTHGRRMTPWTRVWCTAEKGDWSPTARVPRLDGPLLRTMLFTASAPDQSGNTYACHQKTTLVKKIPAVDLLTNPPDMSRHTFPMKKPPPGSVIMPTTGPIPKNPATTASPPNAPGVSPAGYL